MTGRMEGIPRSPRMGGSGMNRSRALRCILALLIPLILHGTVAAEPSGGAAKAAPSGRLSLKVTSDLLSVFPDKNFTEFTGHVEALYQGRLLKCARLRAFFSKQTRQLERIEAEEDVVLVDKEIEANCDRAVYFK